MSFSRRLSAALLMVLLMTAAMHCSSDAELEEVGELLSLTSDLSTEAKLDTLWDRLGGRPYLGGTLTTAAEEEELVIRLDSFDCVTWIDNATALLLSATVTQYRSNLVHNRYFKSEISFATRRHFFTDWLDRPDWLTPEFARVNSTLKTLNRAEDGNIRAAGQPYVEREIQWIPTNLLAERSHRLRTGDLLGIYTELPGLDVTHVGLIQIREETAWLLHASSDAGRLVRVKLLDYLNDRQGAVVIRGAKLKSASPND